MSIFSIGGHQGIIVEAADLKPIEDDDRYFMPGIIHGGEDYIIQAYYWSNDEGPAGDRIGARYLYASDILDWANEASTVSGSLDEERFTELINAKSEEFVVLNNGTGDFVSLNDCWAQARPLSYQEIISWAERQVGREAPEGRVEPGVNVLAQEGNDKLFYLSYTEENNNKSILVKAPAIETAVRYLKSKIPDVRFDYDNRRSMREATPGDIESGCPVLTLTEKEQENLRKDFLASDIEELELTVRSYNTLRRAGIKTIQDLVVMTEGELKQLRNMGWKCFDEITSVLSQNGESLSPSLLHETKVTKKPSLDDRIRSVAHYAENETVKESLQQSDKIRNMTLDACYNIPGYTYLQREDKKKLYDMVKKSVSLSLSKRKEPERE